MDRQGAESGYSNLDQTQDAMKYVRRLDEMRASAFWRAIKERTFLLLAPEPGEHILDVGCGTGDDVRTIAQLLGSTGLAVGIDTSTTMIEEAHRRSAHLGPNVVFRAADAQSLPFPDASFDGCRAERVLQHLTEPDHVLSEMKRVLRSRGRVVLVEPDYGMLAIKGADPRVTSEILCVRRQHFRSSRIGSELAKRMRALGFGQSTVQVKILASTTLGREERARVQKYALAATWAGSISVAESEQWLNDLESSEQAGRYYHAVAIFIVTSRKP